MRIALLSALGAQFGEPGRGLTPFAGRTVLALQADVALALGCKRIVCLAETVGPEISALQQQVDAAGAKFNAIAAHRNLSGMVSATDELFVVMPGLLPDREWLSERFSDRAGVAVLPIESGLEHGFERIDRDRAWGGVLLIRGDAVEALSALPADGDPIAGLLRVALQRGVRAVPIPEAALDDGRWPLVHGPGIAARLERQWLKRHVPSPKWTTPGQAIGYRLARIISTKSRSTWLPMLFLAGAVVFALAGGMAGHTGRVAAGFLALYFATLMVAVGTQLARFAKAGSSGTPRRWPEILLTIILDAALVVTATGLPVESRVTGIFAALVIVASVRLSQESEAPAWSQPFGDRTISTLAAFCASLSGYPALGLAAIGLSGLYARLLKSLRLG